MENNYVGKKIRQLRLERGLTQQKLAVATGLKHKTFIARYETGQVKQIPYNNLVKIADYFGVTLSELIGETGDEISAAYLKKLVDAGFTIERVSQLTPKDMIRLGAYLQAILDEKK